MSETRRRLEEAARRFLEEVAEDFRTSAPGVRVADREEVRRVCGADAAACYVAARREILLGEGAAGDVGTLLHEFAHHLQLEEAEGSPERAFSGFDRPHCERPHEVAAKAFAADFFPFYAKRYRAILSGETGPKRDGALACGFSVATLWKRAEEGGFLLLGSAERVRELGSPEAAERTAREFAASIAPELELLVAAAGRACGGDPSGRREAALRVRSAAELAREGRYARAQEHLEYARDRLRDSLVREGAPPGPLGPPRRPRVLRPPPPRP